MEAGASRVVVFASRELHPFYRAFAAGTGVAKVLSCDDGEAWLQKGKADLVFIDCAFRTKNGLELLKRIKELRPGTMVVIIAEKSSEETVIQAFEAGARRYLHKPIGLSRLRQNSRSLLSLRAESRETRKAYADEDFSHPPHHESVRCGKPANLMRAIEFIEENLGEELDLGTLAQAGNLSKFQFTRAFKRHFGVSPMRYVKTLRITRAKELLARDDLNITEVALSVGFTDHGSFIRVFKKQTGVLPKNYRAEVRNGPRSLLLSAAR